MGTGGGGDGEGGGVDSEGGGWVDGRSFGRLEGGRGGDGESALVVEVVGHLLPALSLLVLVEARVATSPSFPCSPSESDIVARGAGSETKDFNGGS